MKAYAVKPNLAIYIVCLLLATAGCSVFGKKSLADTQEATEKTAYYQCSGCHGPGAARVNFMSANIVGQKQTYLAAKLRDYRDKKRLDPLMNGISESLSDQEIDDLAAYYANFQAEAN